MDVVFDKILERDDLILPHHGILTPFFNAVAHAYDQNLPQRPQPAGDTAIEQARYRDELKRYIETTPSNLLRRYTDTFVKVFDRFDASLPEIARQTKDEVANLKGASAAVPLLDFLPDPAATVEAVIYPFYGDEVEEQFPALHRQYDRNLCAIARLPYEPASLRSPKLIFPRDFQGTPREMVDAYLKDTPFQYDFL